MASFSGNAIPDKVLDRVARGLERENKDQALADTLCTQRDVSSKKTTQKVLGSSALLNRDSRSNRASSGVPTGAELPSLDQEFDSDVAINTSRKGAQSFLAYDDVESIRQNTNVDPLSEALEACMGNAARQTDAQLNSVLTDSNVNGTFDVTSSGNGEWDTSSSTPFGDMWDGVHDLAPGSDLAFFGQEVVGDLLDNSQVIAESSYFDAGQLDYSELAQMIINKIPGIEQVVLGTSYFHNDAEEGQTVNVAYASNTVAWIGHSRDLYLWEFTANDREEFQDEAPGKNGVDVGYHRHNQVKKGNDDTSVLFTNVSS